MLKLTLHLLIAVVLVAGTFTPAVAQTGDAGGDPQAAASAPPPPAQEDDPDLDINFAQPDFTLAALPTTLRLPRHKSAFRVTHRFTRPLGAGDVGDLADDLFGLDAGAIIGLEFRYAIVRGLQVGLHRSRLDKTIQLFGQYDLRNQRDGFPFGLALMANVEGINNFRDNHAPSIGLLVSREIDERAAIYVEPFFVGNPDILPEDLDSDEDSTFLIGLGARLRVRPTVYLVFEAAPRVGFDPGVDHVSFAVEKRAGGHAFQLNFSNSFASTIGQLARGGLRSDDWFLGFNITRKFF